MKRFLARGIMVVLSVWLACLASGCDDAGVGDIVWGSARLAYGIVDVAT
jgi:hypothetical protein